LTSAGMDRVPESGRSHILSVLRDLLDSKAAIPEMLQRQAVHYFGSLRKAIVAAKKTGGWSKKRITSMLSEMHRAHTLPAYAEARREYPAVVSAAERYFGSWGKALVAAGVDPRLYFVRRHYPESE
jgi:hypothetical protein